jgi:hypothetical protein
MQNLQTYSPFTSNFVNQQNLTNATGGTGVVNATLNQVGWEYIKTIKVSTSTESAYFDVTGLDTSIYSGFQISASRLSYGGTVTQTNWTIQVITGTSTVDTSTNYEYQYIKPNTTYSGTVASGTSSWSLQFGYGGAPAPADFVMYLNITPSQTSGIDASMLLQGTDSKTGGYWGSSIYASGIHTSNGADITGIRFSNSQNFRAMTATGTAYIDVFGKRIKS